MPRNGPAHVASRALRRAQRGGFRRLWQRGLKRVRCVAACAGLKGRVLLASEGINANLAGSREGITGLCELLEAHTLFGGIDFKLDTSDEDNAFGCAPWAAAGSAVACGGRGLALPEARSSTVSCAQWDLRRGDMTDASEPAARCA